MVLRCSLLGHDYAEREVDREREERGSEVVVTVTEYERCERCGEKHVVSENTEVTTLGSAGAEGVADAERPDDDSPTDGTSPSVNDEPPSPETTTADDADPAGGPGPDSTEEAQSDSTGGLRPDATGEARPDSTGEARSDSTGTPDATAPAADGTEPDQPAVDEAPPEDGPGGGADDAEIITDDPDVAEGDAAPGRERGEWPSSDDVGPPVGADDESGGWPDDEGDSHPADAERAVSGDAATGGERAFADADRADSAVAGSGGDSGAGTRQDETTHPAAGSDADAAGTAGTGIESPGTAPAPGEGASDGSVPSEFYCPQCSFVAPGDRGSLRAGDICPECRKGYLGERERR